jgi:hypothetical protein
VRSRRSQISTATGTSPDFESKQPKREEQQQTDLLTVNDEFIASIIIARDGHRRM